MDLEQLPPHKPNFLMVVLIAAGVLLMIFVIALAAVHWDGRRLLPRGFAKRTTSQLVKPATVVVPQA